MRKFREKVTIGCKQCSNPYVAYKHELDNGTHQFCTTNCKGLYKHKITANIGIPKHCTGQWEDDCDYCEHIEVVREVGHPGGGLSTVEERQCALGYWQDNF